jgi:hypothetical protein
MFILIYVLEFSLRLNSMKSFRAISRVRDLIPDDDNRDGPRNVGSMQSPDMADSPRILHRMFILVPLIPFRSFSPY